MFGTHKHSPGPSHDGNYNHPHKRRVRWTVEQARQVLAKHALGGGSLADFAKREGYDLKRLQGWQNRFEREAASLAAAKATSTATVPLFLPVQLTSTTANHSTDCEDVIHLSPVQAMPLEVVLSGERRIVVPTGFDEFTFCRLVRLLEGVDKC